MNEYLHYLDEGIAANEQAKRRAENPYIQGSNAWKWWNDGWDYSHSRQEQLELVSA